MKLYAFAPFELTPETQRAIVELTDQRIIEVLHQSESFRAQNRKISRREWKLIHTNEELNAYRRQQPSPPRSRLHSNTVAVLEDSCGSPSSQWPGEPEFVCSQDGSDEASASTDAISILLTGIQSGHIEDFALGSLAATESMTRLRHLQVDDEFEDFRVLATIHAPTEGDPFRYLGIKWMMKDLGPFLKRRDFVYVEATGLTFDARGQRLSYQLRHSIELPHAPDLSQFGIIRGEMSTCIIARQYDSANLEIYGRGLGEPHGKVNSCHVVSRYASDVASAAGIVDCAFSKKALWVMRQPYARKLTPASLQGCQVCSKRFNVIEKITHAHVCCQICRQAVCKRCSVDKKITIDGANDVVTKTFSFCVECFLEAKDVSATKVAIASLRSHDKPQQQQTHISSAHSDVVAETLSKSPVSQLHPVKVAN